MIMKFKNREHEKAHQAFHSYVAQWFGVRPMPLEVKKVWIRLEKVLNKVK